MKMHSIERELRFPLLAGMIFLLLAALSVHAVAQTAREVSAVATITPPTQRVDGTPLAPSEIEGYRLYYAIDGTPTKASPSIQVATSEPTTITLQLQPRPEPYTVRFAATAIAGGESDLSVVRALTFTVRSTAVPAAPAVSVELRLTCDGSCVVTPVE